MNVDSQPRKYLREDFKNARDGAKSSGVTDGADAYFYDSLLLLNSRETNTDQSLALKQVETNQTQLSKSCESPAPLNLQCKYDLVEAERHRVLGNKLEAMEHYERAIAGAAENGLFVEEAIANSLAASFYFEWGKDKFAAVHLDQARDGYRRLGNYEKAEQLQTVFSAETTACRVVAGDEHLLDGVRSSSWTEARLKKITQRFQSLLECSSLGVWEWNATEDKLIWDAQMFTIYGVSPNEFKGRIKDWSDCLHPEDFAKAIGEFTHQKKGIGLPEKQFRIIHPGGEIRHILSTAYFENDPQNGVEIIYGFNEDVTDSHRTEIALRETEERLHSTVRDLPGFSYRIRITPEGEVAELLDVSAGCIDVFEVSAASFTNGQYTLRDFLHPEDRERVIQWTYRVNEQFTSAVNEFRIVSLSGTVRWLRVSTHPVKHASDGSSIWVANVFDLTDQISAEFALAESEAKFRTLVEDAVDVIWSAAIDKTFTYLSPQFKNLSGFDPQDWIGRTGAELIHPDDYLEAIEYFENRICDADSTVNHEFRQLRRDGSYIWVMVKAKCVCDDSGQVIGRQGIVRDISDRKAAELALKETETQFHRMTENSPGMLFRFKQYSNGTDEMIYIGPQVREIFDLEPEVVTRDLGNLIERIHPDDKPRVWQEFTVSAKSLQPLTTIFRLRLPDSEIRWIKAMTNVHPQGADVVWDGIAMDISDIKLMEAEKDRQSTIIENTSDFVGTVNLDGKSVYSNRALRELPIGSNGEVSQRRCAHPDWAEEIVKKVGRPAAAKNGLWTGETALVDGDGNEFPVSQVIIAHRSPDGEVEHYSTICRDIGERKKIELDLEEARTRLLRLTESVPGVIYQLVFSGNGDHYGANFINSNCRQLYGVEHKKVLNGQACLLECVHPEDIERLKGTMKAAVVNLAPFKAEFRVKVHGQNMRWLQSTGSPEMLENGRTSLAGITLDITNQKLNELAHQQTQMQFKRMTENVPGMIFRYFERSSGIKEITYVSSQCRELFEINPRDALGHFSKLMDYTDPDDRQRIIAAIDSASKNLDMIKIEYRVILPNQGLRWRQSVAHPTRTRQGDTIWDGIVIDITNQKRTELQLRGANQKLAKATKMKDEFLANMSHELRTPLAAILAVNEGLQKGVYGVVTGDQAEGLNVIEASGAHLLELIDEVLDLAKIESGSLQLNFSKIIVTTICDSSLQFVKQQAARKSIQLRMDVPENLPEIHSDEKRLRQILVNLLSNAVKFTEDNGSVTLACEQISRSEGLEVLRFSVTDTGIGIDESKLDILFEPFFQVQTALNRDYSGTGLGLALVKQFAELLSATVGVSSEIGVGSRFYLDLPLGQSEIPNGSNWNNVIDNNNAQQLNRAVVAADSPPLILLAEDSDSVAEATTRYLELSQYRVIRVGDGKTAIEAARDHSPDVILMDIQMPGIDGLEAIRRLRAIPSFESTPIIALTGLAMQGDSSRCIAAGADQYLSKPYRMRELVSLIQSLMQLSEA